MARGRFKSACGVTATVEYKVAFAVAWRYRRWAHRNGVSNRELIFDLIPQMVSARKTWREDGASLEVYLFGCAVRKLGQIMDRPERTRERRERWPHLRHVTTCVPSRDLEQQEIVRLAMAGIANPRDRAALSMYCGGVHLREIGRRLGISGERASQIIDRAIREARHALMREAVRVGSTLDECWR